MTKEKQQQETLNGWLEEHRGIISRVIRAWAFNSVDRADLLQEIALRLCESISSFRKESAVSTWVYRVSLYAAMAWSRRERRYKGRAEELEFDPLDSEPEEDPRVALLYEQIAKLGEVDRSLALLLLDGWSYREMADSLGMTESNVSVRIHRMKIEITTHLERGDQHDL